MCGICGLVAIDSTVQVKDISERVETMIAALAHRGPNGFGIAGANPSVFGFARLAIRGLADGQQPITDPESSVMMICNGEIDNHQELRAWLSERGRTVKQTTDVAVIPALYLELGEGFVDRLVGAFAIAIWDPRKQRLLLARDRAGERPLFYTIQNGVVGFASQIAALASIRTKSLSPDIGSLQAYLQSGYFAGTATPFVEIEKVSPSEIITIDASGIRRRRYWNWKPAVTEKTTNPLEAFDRIFRESVRLQSEVDVDFGLFLSGGLDSSLIAAVTRQIRPEKRLQAYTIRFSEASYDEGSYAEQVAASLGIDCIPVWVRPEDFPETLAELVSQSGEPLADPAWVPTAILSRRAASDIRVALVGEGADELFGGYPTYFGAGVAEYYASLPRALRVLVRKAVESWPASDKKVTLSFLLKRFVLGDELDALARHRLWNSSISPAVLERLGITPPDFSAPDYPAGAMLDRIQQFDLERSLAEGLLTKADRASMRSALELRAPFLDQAVMEFAASLPEKERVSGLQTKIFLKRYALGYLPASIVHRRKRGLSVPLSNWLRGPLFSWAESRLSSRLLDPLGINRRTTSELLNEHRLRKADHARALWTLIVLGEWLEWAESSGKQFIALEGQMPKANPDVKVQAIP